jgi:hypothetical protein
MNIISRLHNQLSIVKGILITEIESGSYTLNYIICETESKFLDKHELQECITNTDFKNTVFLKMINESCVFIINAWQNELQSIPNKKLKNDLIIEGDLKGLITKDDFHVFFIREERIVKYNSINDKIDFVKKHDYTLLDISEIAIRSNLILNWITAAYPETIPDSLKSSNNSSSTKPSFNPNNFNLHCYELFEYLVENYEKEGKIKYINIFYFLNKEINSEKVVFNFTQLDYMSFILKTYNIAIKKFAKAEFKFDEDEVPILNQLYQNFLQDLN